MTILASTRKEINRSGGDFTLAQKRSLRNILAEVTPTVDQFVTATALNSNVVAAYLLDGAIAPVAGTAKLTKATAGAYTLAAPAAAIEGAELTITSATDAAHVVTATGLLDNGVTGGSKNTATFAAFAGATITLVAIGLKWNVKALNAVVVA